MERFTNGTIGLKNISDCGKAIDRLAAYEDTGLTPEEVAELAKAKADGRLMVLPCKVGDYLWANSRYVPSEKVPCSIYPNCKGCPFKKIEPTPIKVCSEDNFARIAELYFSPAKKPKPRLERSRAMLSKEQIAEIEQRAKKATPGPWKVVEKGDTIKSVAVTTFAVAWNPQEMICPNMSPKTGNADFIARARTDIPALLEHIRELEAQLAKEKRRAEKALGYIKKIFGCDECVHDDDDTNYATCRSCNIYDNWQWRGDVEEGDIK
jgi:hypothetical protein